MIRQRAKRTWIILQIVMAESHEVEHHIILSSSFNKSSCFPSLCSLQYFLFICQSSPPWNLCHYCFIPLFPSSLCHLLESSCFGDPLVALLSLSPFILPQLAKAEIVKASLCTPRAHAHWDFLTLWPSWEILLESCLQFSEFSFGYLWDGLIQWFPIYELWLSEELWKPARGSPKSLWKTLCPIQSMEL